MTDFEHAGGHAAGSELREVLSALDFAPESWDQPARRLSTGQRRRLALVAVLAAPTDVLLLDEPTNHLDVAARTWLERHLARRAGAVVLVSHDRALLDACTTATAFLASATLRVVRAAYGRARRRVEAEDAASARRAKEMRREAERLERVAADLARYGRRAKARERSARELAKRAESLGQNAPDTNDVALTSGRSDRKVRGWLLSAEDLSAPGTYSGVGVRISAGESAALMGPNGSGKSTLLAQLAGAAPLGDVNATLEYARGVRLGYVGQRDRGLLDGEPVLAQFARPLGEERARSALAAAGLPFLSWSSPPEGLSGGERARAGLALALALEPDLLLLDEPDNDLDLHGVEALEDALRTATDRGMALVVATHDRRLATSVADRTWQLEEGRLVAHASVRAFLAGEKGVPAEKFWTAEELAPTEADALSAASQDPTEALEEERAALLQALSDPVGTTERDRQRARQRLSEVEGALLSHLDATLSAPEPRYRLRERGVPIYGDAHGDGTWRLAATPAAGVASATFAGGAPGVPTLELTLLSGVGHLALLDLEGACILPHVAGALIDAGVRLAFTVAGSRVVQAFPPANVEPTYLERGDDGWWYSDLESFLQSEGWARPARRLRRRAGGRGEGG